MKTSYKNCHPEIAASLQRGEHIRCVCNNFPHTIIAYVQGYDYPYIDDTSCKYDNAVPIKTTTYVIDAVSMMKGLVERGYVLDHKGYWSLGMDDGISPSMWIYCGKPVIDYIWEPWMLIDKEVE